jgi:tetratricopeptide (TPR) repeat protein
MCPSDASGDLFQALSASLLRAEALPELASDSMSSLKLATLLQKNPEGVCLMIRQALAQAAEKMMIHEEQDLRDMIKEMDQECRAADVASIGRRLADLKPTQARMVLVIDQMEEMFTQDLTPQQRQEFIHTISIIARSGQVFVIATLRSDFYPRCMELPELLELKKGEGLHDLEKPTPEEIGQMIREPAVAAGVQFQVDPQSKQALDEVLRDSAIKDPSILPLLEFMLEQLFERRTQGGELTFQAYKTLEGIEGAVANRAKEVFSMLTTEEQQAFNKVMRGLVTPGLIDEDTFNRRWALYDKLTCTPGAKVFVDAFIEARLFMADKNEKGEPVVSVSHEALINRWPRLRQWVKENQEFLRIRARVSQAAARWRQEEEIPDFLLPSGKPLVEAQNILINYRDDLEPELIRFIELSSKQEQDRHMRQVRRARNVAIVMGVLFILAVIGTIIALIQFRQAKRQGQIAISTLANSYFLQGTKLVEEDKADRALSFFAQAVRLTRHKASATRITTLLTQRNWLFLKSEPMRHESIVNSAQFSPEGTCVVTASDDNTARVWDAATGKPLSEPMRHENRVNSAQFSSDGFRVVTASLDKTARVWDAATGKPLSEPMCHEDNVISAQFSPEGTRVVTTSWNNTARVWDAATGKPVGEPMRHEGYVNSPQFSPEGTRVVTASRDKTARVWEISPVQDPPMWLADLAEALGGWQVNDFGRVVPKENRDELLKEIRSKLSKLSEDDAWAKMARWCFMERSSRTISPNATITIPEYVLRRIKENSISSLNDALDMDPGNPLALARLGKLRLYQNESENPYGKNQADTLTALAARLAPDNAKVLYLRGEVLQHIGRPAEALQAFTKAHELNETFQVPDLSEGLITPTP